MSFILKLLCRIGLHDWIMGAYGEWMCENCEIVKKEHYS